MRMSVAAVVTFRPGRSTKVRPLLVALNDWPLQLMTTGMDFGRAVPSMMFP